MRSSRLHSSTQEELSSWALPGLYLCSLALMGVHESGYSFTIEAHLSIHQAAAREVTFERRSTSTTAGHHAGCAAGG